MAHAGLWLLAGVLLGSVTGAATATFLAPQRPGLAQESAADFAARVAASMEKAVDRTVERVREETAAAQSVAAKQPRAAEPRANGDLSPEGSGRAAREQAAASGEAGEDLLVRDGTVAFAPKNTGRLELLVVRSRETAAARRRDWMFVGERVVAASLGLPDDVAQRDDGREEWSYLIPCVNAKGERDARRLRLLFSRGRVVEIAGAEDIAE